MATGMATATATVIATANGNLEREQQSQVLVRRAADHRRGIPAAEEEHLASRAPAAADARWCPASRRGQHHHDAAARLDNGAGRTLPADRRELPHARHPRVFGGADAPGFCEAPRRPDHAGPDLLSPDRDPEPVLHADWRAPRACRTCSRDAPSTRCWRSCASGLRLHPDRRRADGDVRRQLVPRPRTDGVILVVRAESTPLGAPAISLRELERVGAHVLGAVLNRTQTFIPEFPDPPHEPAGRRRDRRDSKRGHRMNESVRKVPAHPFKREAVLRDRVRDDLVAHHRLSRRCARPTTSRAKLLVIGNRSYLHLSPQDSKRTTQLPEAQVPNAEVENLKNRFVPPRGGRAPADRHRRPGSRRPRPAQLTLPRACDVQRPAHHAVPTVADDRGRVQAHRQEQGGRGGEHLVDTYLSIIRALRVAGRRAVLREAQRPSPSRT